MEPAGILLILIFIGVAVNDELSERKAKIKRLERKVSHRRHD
jgi:hypothetical protein